MIIIPAIDLINGQCVRLTKGDYNRKTIYNENPLEVAQNFEAAGITHLHLVDLDGAKSKAIVNWKVLHTIASKTNLIIDFGGGIKSKKDLQIAFDNGASQVTCGSIAAKNPDLVLSWINEFGADKIILGADCKAGKIATNGWLDQTNIEVIDFIKEYKNRGIEYVISTDIEKDGMLNGPSFSLYEKIQTACPQLNIIASGGITTIEDIKTLQSMKIYGAIIGKSIYEGRIKLEELVALC